MSFGTTSDISSWWTCSLITRAFVSATSWIPISNLTISLLGHELLLSVDQARELLQRPPQLDRAALEPSAVRGETLEQRLRRRVQQRLDLVQRDVELAQAADRLAVARLVERVPPVARVLVHVRRHEQADRVVTTQGADGQARRPGEAADREQMRAWRPSSRRA